MEKAHAGDVADVGSQRQIAVDDDSKISDNLRRLDGGAGHDHCVHCALLPTSRRPKPYELGLRRVDTKPIACRPAFNACNAVCHPRLQKLGGLCWVRIAEDLQIVSISVSTETLSCRLLSAFGCTLFYLILSRMPFKNNEKSI